MALSEEGEVVLRVIYAVLIVVNIAGNSLVCLVVRRFVFMKTPMNYLLVHLAICDILIGVFMFPRRVFWGLYDHPSGLVGDILCKLFTYGNMCWWPSCASVFTLIVIAWERYNAIMKPLAPRFSNKKIKIVLVLCWVLGFFLSLPETLCLAYNPSIKSCDFMWRTTWGGEVDLGLWLFGFGLVPSSILLVLYGKVVRTLWWGNNRTADVSQRSLQKSRKRITKTAVTVTVILFVCWMPNLLYTFIVAIMTKSSPQTKLYNVAPVFYPITHVFLLLNSSINPFIYAIQDVRFRKCTSRLLCGRRLTGRRNTENNINEQENKT